MTGSFRMLGSDGACFRCLFSKTTPPHVDTVAVMLRG